MTVCVRYLLCSCVSEWALGEALLASITSLVASTRASNRVPSTDEPFSLLALALYHCGRHVWQTTGQLIVKDQDVVCQHALATFLSGIVDSEGI